MAALIPTACRGGALKACCSRPACEQSAQFDALLERRIKREEARAVKAPAPPTADAPPTDAAAAADAAEEASAPTGAASAAQKEMLDAMRAQLATKHSAATASMGAAQALESQNALLLEQVRPPMTTNDH